MSTEIMMGTVPLSVEQRQQNIPLNVGQQRQPVVLHVEAAREAVSDYNRLLNKPSINGVPLVGDISLPELGLRGIYYDTTANWNAQPTLVAQAGSLYIYSDFEEIVVDGNTSYAPNIKIGDGTSYLIDLPFLSSVTTKLLLAHINNTTIHVTAAERELWNNKVSAFLSEDDLENLVLSKLFYVTEGDVYHG